MNNVIVKILALCMIKDLESDCITCSLFIEIYIIIQCVFSRILFDWIEVAVIEQFF